MTRILLAWELGGGLGHIVRFGQLISEFRDRGHSVSLALTYPQHAKNLNLEESEITIVPEWPGVARRRRERSGISWITYGDMLADILFADANEIATQISAWRRVISNSKANIVIADYAPGAVLAARDFARCVNVGDGYTMPPHEMGHFPRLWPGDAPIKHVEAEVAARISEALAQHEVSPLLSYPDMNAATAHATMTIPLLDVYQEWRSGGWLGGGPFTFSMPAPETRAGIFATVYEDMQFDERIIEGIAGSGIGGMVMIPNLLRKNRKLLAAAGFKIPNELQPLDSVLQDVRVLVHHGGMGTAIAGIAKGVPQLIIYSDLDKYHRGKAICDAGAGLMLSRKTVSKQQIIEAIRALAHEPSYFQRAKQLSQANAALLKTSAISALADLVESTA